jgi:hypothetical protein
MTTYVHLWYLAQFSLEWEMFHIKIAEKIKTHFISSNVFFFEKRAVYEIMWKNMVEPDRPQATIWYGACAYMPDNYSKNTNTHKT